jgi:hypothetical protein
MELLSKEIKELEEKGYYTYGKGVCPVEFCELNRLGYICELNHELYRVELLKTDFIFADKVKKYSENKITGIEFFNCLYDGLKVVDIFNEEGSVIFVGEKKDDKFVDGWLSNEVKEKEEIIDLITNGGAIEIYNPSVMSITLTKKTY